MLRALDAFEAALLSCRSDRAFGRESARDFCDNLPLPTAPKGVCLLWFLSDNLVVMFCLKCVGPSVASALSVAVPC